MTCSILVGGAWGDEGKGKCITYLCDNDKPSIIALACNYIVIKFFNININDLIAQNVYQNINPNEVIDCARYLFNLNKYLSQSTLVAIKNKYSTDKYMNIAQINFNNFDI